MVLVSALAAFLGLGAVSVTQASAPQISGVISQADLQCAPDVAEKQDIVFVSCGGFF